MEMNNIPFGTIDWSDVEPTQHPGEPVSWVALESGRWNIAPAT